MNQISENELTTELKEITSTIKEAANPEKIILTGTITAGIQPETIFSDAKEYWQTVIQYDLLVLTTPAVQTGKTALQDTIEGRCRHIVPVTSIILFIEEFNALAAEAHPFATRIYHHATLLYDAQTVPFVLPPYREVSVQELKDDFCHWTKLAGSFLMGVEMYLANKQYRLAAFLLHQAAEHFYHAILQLHTGYRFNTHNLDKLYRYSRSISKDLHCLFPQHTDEEKRLFQKLQQGYIDGRYNKEFRIGEAELLKLIERVRQLQSIARAFYKKHFKSIPVSHQLPSTTEVTYNE